MSEVGMGLDRMKELVIFKDAAGKHPLSDTSEVPPKTKELFGDINIAADRAGFLFSATAGSVQRWKADNLQMPFDTKATGRIKDLVHVLESSAVIAIVDSSLVAWNDHTGSLLWTATTLSPRLNKLIASSGLVFAGSEGGLVFCWEAQHGKELWKVELGKDDSYGVLCMAASELHSVVCLGTDAGRIYGLDQKTGAKRWATKHGAEKHAGPPDIRVLTVSKSGDTIFSGGSGGRLVAWNSQTGEQRWSFRVCDKSSMQALCYSDYDDSVCAACQSGRLRIFDAANGSTIMENDVPNVKVMLVSRENLFIMTPDSVAAYSTQQPLRYWEVTSSMMGSKPAAMTHATVSDCLAVGTASGVVVLDPKNGSQRTKKALSQGVQKLIYTSR
eukprot:TRINITY_DN10497_c0_g1_i3.p1 TRINITY_DN10497_c0_g1~~TRINITY_DN10497_c0_g1_i3.p1  ORF type:complete len:386 (+),score=74.98 TRINITY_DN10497_c0_g1_i3:244-1401(+)